MALPSGAIRMRLGPTKKRLLDTIAAVQAASLAKTLSSHDAHSLEEKLRRYLDHYKILHDQLAISAQSDDSEMDRITAEGEEYMGIIFDAEDALATLNSPIVPDGSAAIQTNPPAPEQSNNLLTPEHHVNLLLDPLHPTFKLHNLALPVFDGDVMRWREFWDSFTSAVDQNSRLRPVDKLNYLKAQLKGQAAECIEGLEFIGPNYDVAVSLLKERFGDSLLIINRYHRLSQSVKPSTTSIENLRITLDTIEKTLRSLETLGEDVSQSSFIPLIRSKFPPSVDLLIEERIIAEGPLSVSDLRKILRKIITARERISFNSKNESNRTEVGNSKSTTEALVTREVKCIFCGVGHWSDECPTYNTLAARKEKVRGRCFCCLRYGHSIKKCPKKRPCFYCKKYHHRSLCSQSKIVSSESHNIVKDPPQKEVNCMSIGENVVMQTATVKCLDMQSSRSITVRAFFDCGSQRTYVTSNFARLLHLDQLNNEELLVYHFGAKSPKHMVTPKVQFGVTLSDGSIMKLSANVTPTIVKRPLFSSTVTRLREKFPDLKFADGPENYDKEIHILIGNDFYFDFIGLDKIQVEQGLYLIHSRLGWIVSGRHVDYDKQKSSLAYSCLDSDSYALAISNPVEPYMSFDGFNDVNKLWDLETIGIRETPEINEDDLAITQFNSSIVMCEGRYFVSWPWKEFPPSLGTNFTLAFRRFQTLFKKLNDSKDILHRYHNTIIDQLSKGIIEKVDTQKSPHVTHYIPHHAVLTPLKTSTKLRIVYDASAKASKKDKSLNECLLRGRHLLEDLVGILIRFRLQKFAAVGDIEKAYLQVGLNIDSRDATRFIWVNDISRPPENENLQIFRFCRVPFGFISSAFLLSAVIKHHLNNTASQLANSIANNIYVDNLVITFDEEQSGPSVYREAKEIFSSASMNLREWSTNSVILRNFFSDADRVENQIIKVLGLYWDTYNDRLSLKQIDKGSHDNTVWTKRAVLKYISLIFDPLGILCPISLLEKLFVKDLWEQKLDWDKSLNNELRKKWEKVYNDMMSWESVDIPRYIGRIGAHGIQLHCFTDASKKAYSAVVYMRVEGDDSSINTNILVAKSRISPTRMNMTIPRLELLGVLIGIRLLKFLNEHLKIKVDKQFLWTDSKCTLYWISTTKPLSLFVERRIREIKETKSIQFSYAPGTENVADVASRGSSFKDLKSMLAWWEGPSWLRQTQDFWPRITPCLDESEDGEIACPITLNQCSTIHPPFYMDETKFSSLSKLLNITNNCLSYVRNHTKLPKRIQLSKVNSKLVWERYIQAKAYPEILNALNKQKFNPLKKQLGLWLDDDKIIRCSGRLLNADIADESKFPKLLPNNEYYSKLVVESIHKKLFHAGVSHTLAALRAEYWITQGRSYVFKVLRSCLVCRRIEGRPYQQPEMPPLPKFRVTRSRPFSNTGIDLIGPFFIRDKNNCTVKAWSPIFSCLVTRAVHLELMENATTSEFVLALRRFAARRGFPQLIISDNAGQFKVVRDILMQPSQELLISQEVIRFANSNGVEWKFIPEFSPWMGGVYERLVGLVKRCLRKSLGRARLTFSQLSTYLVEVEAILNSRPLIYVGADDIGEEILTPSHFLTNYHPEIPKNIVEEEPISFYNPDLIEKWKKGKRLLDSYWELWRKQYLLTLRERRSWQKKTLNEKQMPRIGQVVLIGDKSPRIKWKLGKIIILNKSEDGRIRSAQLDVGRGIRIIRPLKMIYPLECDEEKRETA